MIWVTTYTSRCNKILSNPKSFKHNHLLRLIEYSLRKYYYLDPYDTIDIKFILFKTYIPSFSDYKSHRVKFKVSITNKFKDKVFDITSKDIIYENNSVNSFQRIAREIKCQASIHKVFFDEFMHNFESELKRGIFKEKLRELINNFDYGEENLYAYYDDNRVYCFQKENKLSSWGEVIAEKSKYPEVDFSIDIKDGDFRSAVNEWISEYKRRCGNEYSHKIFIRRNYKELENALIFTEIDENGMYVSKCDNVHPQNAIGIGATEKDSLNDFVNSYYELRSRITKNNYIFNQNYHGPIYNNQPDREEVGVVPIIKIQ
jgi:hypothetical protein